METYYRRRSKKARQPTINMEVDQSCHKEAVQGSITAADSPVLGPPPSPSSHLLLQETEDREKSQMQNHIKPGYLYEIDHAHLPTRAPVQLRSIRVAMVLDKTEMNVAVRFPSMESLKTFFNCSTGQTHPALDEKFVMGSALAAKVLIRLVPLEIFSEQKSSVAFWLITSSAADSRKDNVVVTQKEGSCLSEALKGNGMVRWGIRRQVKYLGRHKESECNDGNGQNSSSSFVNGVEEFQMEVGGATCDERESVEEDNKHGDDDDDGGFDIFIGDVGERDENREEKDEGEEEEEENGDYQENDEVEEEENGDNQENDEEEEEEEENMKIKEEANKNLKRKRYSFRNMSAKKTKKEKLEIRKQKQTQKKNQMKKKKGRMRLKEAFIQRDPKDRWSAERYKLAEQNLLAVMKSKGATAEKPILRHQLRAEARKRIGDTGLLDHLLKHMAGKLAPGGQERFRRRHNPDGAMEYWLESADLVDIRRDAGVTDPCWVPPPGWKPGDSPTQDPVCARELKFLKDDISKIKRDLELMATKMQLEKEVGRLRRELDEISSNRRPEQNQAIPTSSIPSDICQKIYLLATSLESSKYDLGHGHVSVEKYKEKLMAISDFVKEIEEKLEKLTPNVAERARTNSSLMEPTDLKQKRASVERSEPKSKEEEVQALIAAEEKAAKIQRLKSGFRICKPQGTFLWPNMVKDSNNNINSSSSKMMSPKVVVQVEVPTPPSVNSSSAAAPPPTQLPAAAYHHYQQPPSIVKPLAEKRAVMVTVSSNLSSYEDGANNYSTTTHAPVDLNDSPTNLNAMPPVLSPPAIANTRGPWESGAYNGPRNAMSYDQKEYYNTCCCSSATSMPPSEMGNWLALSSLKSVSDDSSHG